jgi:hypothetical protein
MRGAERFIILMNRRWCRYQADTSSLSIFIGRLEIVAPLA